MSIPGETLDVPTPASNRKRHARKGLTAVAVVTTLLVAPLTNSPAVAEGWGRAWFGDFSALALIPTPNISEIQNTRAEASFESEASHSVSDRTFVVFQNEARVFGAQSGSASRSLRLWMGTRNPYQTEADDQEWQQNHITAQTLAEEPRTFGIGFQLPLGEDVDLNAALLQGKPARDSSLGRNNRVTFSAAFRF